MRNAAKVILIVGLVLGTISGSLQVFTLVFGDTMLKTINQNQSQLPANSLQGIEALKKATDKSLSHILYISSGLLVIIAGGVLGIVAAYVSKKKIWTTIFGAASIVAGLGLLAFHHWIAAAAYIIGGFFLIIMNEKEAGKDGDASQGTGAAV